MRPGNGSAYSQQTLTPPSPLSPPTQLVQPGNVSAYSQQLRTAGLPRPVWQFMSSGMTRSTAQHSGGACEGSYLEDLVGLRPLGKCAYYSEPNFGTVDVGEQHAWVGGYGRCLPRGGGTMLLFPGRRGLIWPCDVPHAPKEGITLLKPLMKKRECTNNLTGDFNAPLVPCSCTLITCGNK